MDGRHGKGHASRYWCPHGHRWLLHEQAVEAEAGFLICKLCLDETGKQKRIRTRARCHRKKRGPATREIHWTEVRTGEDVDALAETILRKYVPEIETDEELKEAVQEFGETVRVGIEAMHTYQEATVEEARSKVKAVINKKLEEQGVTDWELTWEMEDKE